MRYTRVPRAVQVTVALSAVVAAGALVTAFTMRPEPPGELDAAAEAGCQVQRCDPIVRTMVGGDPVRLLTNRAGDVGELRVGRGKRMKGFDVAITGQGATLTVDSLSCADGATPACLVRGKAEAGMLADVFVSHQGAWSQVDPSFVSDYGYLALHNVQDDSSPEVVAVQQRCADDSATECADPAYFAQVLSLAGAELGCTTPVAEVRSIPGYPEVAPEAANVHSCER